VGGNLPADAVQATFEEFNPRDLDEDWKMSDEMGTAYTEMVAEPSCRTVDCDAVLNVMAASANRWPERN
jgi:hypothetical protein